MKNSKSKDLTPPSYSNLTKDSENFNGFIYARDNPLRFKDPSGLGPNNHCMEYAVACSDGDAYACGAWWACMRGNPAWGGANSPKNMCVRNCLLDYYRKGCSDPVCYGEHIKCFDNCKDECEK